MSAIGPILSYVAPPAGSARRCTRRGHWRDGKTFGDSPLWIPYDGFHTYTLDWYEDKVVFFYDGIRYGAVNLSRADWPDGAGNPFRKPHFLLLNLALGGWGNKVVDEDWTDPKSGKVIPAAKFPMEMKIDWVRYYEKPTTP